MAQWAVRMAETILKREPVLPVNWGYDYELVYRAFYLLYRQTGDRRYFDYIKTNMDRCIDQDGTILCYENKQNIDHLNLGKSLILLYRQTGDLRYKTAADTLRAQIDSQPRTREGGFWHKAIYPDQMWLDGM